MIALLATIRDGNDREVARVEARQEDQDLAIQVICDDDSWRESLADLDRGNLRFMIDGAVYLETKTVNGKEFLALDDLVAEWTGRELHLEYEQEGVERGHELARKIARLQPHNVPFSELFDILKRSVQAG